MKDMNDVAEFVLALSISLLAMACAMLKCSVQSLMRWSRAGMIARAKITPGKVLYSRHDIRRMLAGDA